jgi:hypothetical protein
MSYGSRAKHIAMRLVATAARHDVTYRALKAAHDGLARVGAATLGKAVDYADLCRAGNGHPVARVRAAIAAHMPDLKVRHGPFSGMQYPAVASVGSQLFPKLLGSYERELAPTIERMCRTPYDDIIDVGCAEGYYAVGLARRIPGARVRAYDTDARGRELCERMAEANDVASRVTVGGWCSPETLAALPSGSRVLIVCDCEGYEAELFPEHLIPRLSRAELLIETHDFIDPTISLRLRERFAPTHDIEVIPSIDDVKKAQTYEYAELAPYDIATRRQLIGEYRPAIMEWLHLRPRLS